MKDMITEMMDMAETVNPTSDIVKIINVKIKEFYANKQGGL